jgi:hypothetical protein
MLGSSPNADMPATTVVTLVEQGGKIFSSILSRLFESLRKEFAILYKINKKYFKLYPEKDLILKEGVVSEEDYLADDYNILPVANPSLGTDAVRLAKMQVLMQFINDPMINRKEVLSRYFVILGIPDVDKVLVDPPPPQPSAEDIKAQAQAELYQMQTHEIIMKHDMKALELELKEKEMQMEAAYKGAQVAGMKIQSVATLSQATVNTGAQNISNSEQYVEKEVAISTPQIDYSDVNNQLSQNQLSNQQQQGNMQQGQQQDQGSPDQGQQQAPDQGQQGPQLPPELQQQLQQVAQEQQQQGSGQPGQ